MIYSNILVNFDKKKMERQKKILVNLEKKYLIIGPDLVYRNRRGKIKTQMIRFDIFNNSHYINRYIGFFLVRFTIRNFFNDELPYSDH